MADDKKLYLIREFAEFNYARETENGKPKVSEYGNIYVKGILQRADSLNQNGRIYPKKILEREVDRYKKLIEERRATGELDHADEPVVNLKYTSHVITDIWWEGDEVWGRVEILEKMDQGRQLKALIDDGIKVGISSRALGSVIQRNGANIVQDDLQMICWDFVSEPSTHNAFMMREARQLSRDEVRKIEEIYGKVKRLDDIANELLNIKKI